MIKIGDKMMDGEVYEENAGNKKSFLEMVGKGKVIVVGVPGAFTPSN